MPRPETGSDVFVYKALDKIVPFLCKHNVHPNYITLVGFLTNFLLLSNIAPSHKVLVLVINRILDCLDGEVARKCDMKSKFGSYLDAVSDSFTATIAVVVLTGIKPTFRNLFIVFAVMFIAQNCVMNIDDHSMQTDGAKRLHDNSILIGGVLLGYFTFYHPGSMKFMLP